MLLRLASFTLILILFVLPFTAFTQSRPQRPTSSDKKNERPEAKTPEELAREAERRKMEEEANRAEFDDEIIKINTNLVNVDTVVYDKKTGQILTGLTKDNFAIFEEGKKQEIVDFAMPEAPITVTLVVEYSKWSEIFGYYGSQGQESGHLEVVRPVAQFLQGFINPPDDYASVIAFDLRPTPITDFTNDPTRIQRVVSLLLQNRPAFRENNLFDALNFALYGGTGDSVVLEDNEERQTEYGGMVDVKSPRRAIILVASGIDTFSRLNYGEARRAVAKAGVPIYIISTGNMFFKMYGDRLGAVDGIDGSPGRLTFLQAQNQMNTFAKESGGKHFPMTFPAEIPNILGNINALLRNQYSMAYDAGEEKRKPGKKYKVEVKVDVNGDGKYEEDQYVIQHRPYYSVEKPKKTKKK